nr:adiponectin receptor protein 2 isoform X2 [Macaca nemestrina]
MNEPTENRLGCSRTPEPDVRLRKGHHLDGTRRGDNDSHQGDLEPILEASVLTSHHKKSSEEHECHDEAPQEDEGFMGMSPLLQAHHAMEKMEEFVCKVWEGRWRVIPHDVLPDWLKDNDFLLHGHRPPMPSFRACFKSIFRIHTETGNIWTHLLGCVFFLCLGIFYMFRPNISFVAPLQEKVVFGLFFLGAILCLSFSWLFHTVYCHSEGVSRLFSKSVSGPGPEWNHSDLALCHLGGVPQGCHHRADRLVDADGQPLHHRSCPVCCPDPRTLFPWQM